MVKPRTREEWERFADRVARKILRASDRWCIYDVGGEIYVDECSYGEGKEGGEPDVVARLRRALSEEELELLSEMPDDVYEEFSRRIKRRGSSGL